MRFRLGIKRALDMLLSAAALAALSPLLVIIALIVRLTSPGPALFRQLRVGLHGENFYIYKFRTVYHHAKSDAPSSELRPADVTPVGAALRATSLDELPQLYNILIGQMSIVGPRPLVTVEKRIHKLRTAAGVYSMRPGLTGWAQVNGRDFLDARQKVEYDKAYVDRWSLGFDLRIIARSVAQVLRRDGVEPKR